MSKGSTETIQITDIDQFDAVSSVLRVLKQLKIASAKPVLRDFEYDLKSEFYCGECDIPKDDCYGHRDYDYDDFYYEDREESDEKKPSNDG